MDELNACFLFSKPKIMNLFANSEIYFDEWLKMGDERGNDPLEIDRHTQIA